VETIKTSKMDKTNRNEKYYFFLNPYIEYVFSRCPKCHNTTKNKKLPIVILFDEDKKVMSLNKTCRYCPFCELIIAKKHELDEIAKQFLGKSILKKDEYYVVGTHEKDMWNKSMNGSSSQKEQLENIIFFKDVWLFEMTGGWVSNKEEGNKK